MRTILQILDTAFQNRLLRWTGQLVLVSPPAALLLAQLASTFEKVRVLVAAKEYFAAHPALICFAALSGVISVALSELGRYARSYMRSQGELNEEGLSTLLNALDCAVGENYRRIGKCLRELNRQGCLPARDVLPKIAQPEEQYKAIVNAVHSFFVELYHDKRVKFRVTLARMGPQYVEDIIYYAPPDSVPGVDREDLQFEDVCFSRCKKAASIIVVPDIRRESGKKDPQRLCRRLGGKNDLGSLICYPIRVDGKTVCMVLGIHALQKGVFSDSKEDIDKWEAVLERFEKRLAVEYSLQLIMERVE